MRNLNNTFLLDNSRYSKLPPGHSKEKISKLRKNAIYKSLYKDEEIL